MSLGEVASAGGRTAEPLKTSPERRRWTAPFAFLAPITHTTMNIKSLCSPVLSLMRRLSYGRLFTIVGAVLLAPLCYLLYLQVTATSHDITFNQKEAYGVENIDPARDLLHEVANRRVRQAAKERGDARANDVIAAQK